MYPAPQNRRGFIRQSVAHMLACNAAEAQSSKALWRKKEKQQQQENGQMLYDAKCIDQRIAYHKAEAAGCMQPPNHDQNNEVSNLRNRILWLEKEILKKDSVINNNSFLLRKKDFEMEELAKEGQHKDEQARHLEMKMMSAKEEMLAKFEKDMNILKAHILRCEKEKSEAVKLVREEMSEGFGNKINILKAKLLECESEKMEAAKSAKDEVLEKVKKLEVLLVRAKKEKLKAIKMVEDEISTKFTKDMQLLQTHIRQLEADVLESVAITTSEISSKFNFQLKLLKQQLAGSEDGRKSQQGTIDRLIVDKAVLEERISKEQKNSKEKIKDLEGKNRKLVDENETLQQQLAGLKQQGDHVKVKLSSQMKDLHSENDKYRLELDEKSRDNRKLLHKLKNVEGTLNKREVEIRVKCEKILVLTKNAKKLETGLTTRKSDLERAGNLLQKQKDITKSLGKNKAQLKLELSTKAAEMDKLKKKLAATKEYLEKTKVMNGGVSRVKNENCTKSKVNVEVMMDGEVIMDGDFKKQKVGKKGGVSRVKDESCTRSKVDVEVMMNGEVMMDGDAKKKKKKKQKTKKKKAIDVKCQFVADEVDQTADEKQTNRTTVFKADGEETSSRQRSDAPITQTGQSTRGAAEARGDYGYGRRLRQILIPTCGLLAALTTATCAYITGGTETLL